MPEQTERLELFQHAKEQYLKHQAEITLAQNAIDNADSLGILSKYNPLTPESHQGKAAAALFTSSKSPISLHSLFLNLSRIEMELGNIEKSKAYLATAQKQRSLYLKQSYSLISLTVATALTHGESYYLVHSHPTVG